MSSPEPRPGGGDSTPSPPSRPLRRRLRRPLDARRRRQVLLALAALAFVAALGWWVFSGRESTDDARVRASIHPIAARIEGTVMAVHIVDHQEVTAGQVLFELDRRDYEVELARRRADLAEAEARSRAASTGVPVTATTSESALTGARATVDDARAGVELADRSLAAARGALAGAEARQREAEAEAARAAHDRERLEPLIARDEISRQEFDTAVETERARAAAADAARAAVTVARNQGAVAESRLQQARADLRRREAEAAAAATGPQRVSITEAQAAEAAARVEQARAELERAELDLEYTQVRSPVDGVVSRKSVEVGEYVRPGQTMLAVVGLDDVWVVANFKETQVRAMRPGQEAKIEVDAYSGIDLRGRVAAIGAATNSTWSLLPPENASGNFVKVVQRLPVKIVLDQEQDPERPLRPGMSVVATVYLRSRGSEP